MSVGIKDILVCIRYLSICINYYLVCIIYNDLLFTKDINQNKLQVMAASSANLFVLSNQMSVWNHWLTTDHFVSGGFLLVFNDFFIPFSKNPTVFLGYVTSSPYSRDYFQFVHYGNMEDIDPGDRFRWCQYIMYKKLIK